MSDIFGYKILPKSFPCLVLIFFADSYLYVEYCGGSVDGILVLNTKFGTHIFG